MICVLKKIASVLKNSDHLDHIAENLDFYLVWRPNVGSRRCRNFPTNRKSRGIPVGA